MIHMCPCVASIVVPAHWFPRKIPLLKCFSTTSNFQRLVFFCFQWWSPPVCIKLADILGPQDDICCIITWLIFRLLHVLFVFFFLWTGLTRTPYRVICWLPQYFVWFFLLFNFSKEKEEEEAVTNLSFDRNHLDPTSWTKKQILCNHAEQIKIQALTWRPN